MFSKYNYRVRINQYIKRVLRGKMQIYETNKKNK